MKLIPDSNDVDPSLINLSTQANQNQPTYEVTEPYDAEASSTEAEVDDYKDMIIEMHRFAKRQKAQYKWDDIK